MGRKILARWVGMNAFPHPLWMAVIGLLLPLPAALAGARLAVGKPA